MLSQGMYRYLIGSIVFVCSLAQLCIAQADQSGNFAPPLALYHGSDLDNVSLPMRNARLRIPLLHLKGRGLDFDLNATFNNVTWTTNEIDDPSGMRIYDTEYAAGGWGVGVARMGAVDGY